MDVGAGTITYFIPTLTQNLGYKGNTAQLMTVPVYSVTLVCSVCVFLLSCELQTRAELNEQLGLAWSSDYFQEKPLHVVIPMFFAGLFYILSIPVTNKTAQYVFLWCAVPPLVPDFGIAQWSGSFGFGGTWGALPIMSALHFWSLSPTSR